MRYVDTSALLPLYHVEALSPRVAQALATGGEALAFTWLHEVEFQNALQLKRYRGEADETAISATLELIRADAAHGVLHRVELQWPEVFRQTLALSLLHSAVLGTRSLDVLHVATALHVRAGEFITCDQRQARLADAAGLTTTLVS